MTYNWQRKDWPSFQYDLAGLDERLYVYTEQQGLLNGMINALPEHIGKGAIIDIMVAEAVKTSEIEGEYISRQDVLSSIRNQLGLNSIPENIKDKRAAGVAELMVHIREKYALPLDHTMLFQWHGMVMESYININIGLWRSGQEPMHIISGPIGKEIIHFEAPPSKRVPKEMKAYINWYNRFNWSEPKNKFRAIIHSAIAHLYFESIHPFEDGNGRIGRALSEKLLSQAQGQPILFGLSKAIEKNKKQYYEALKNAQNSNRITEWIQFFIEIVLDAQNDSTALIKFTIFKTKFFDRIADLINIRQEKALSKMLNSHTPFEGGMNTKKYMSITKTSRATATRDLQDLAKLNIMITRGGGRSTRYEINVAFPRPQSKITS